MCGAPWPGAVAVSGGSDSIALMHMLSDWAGAHDLARPVVLTVDHGLQTGSASVAKDVIRAAKVRGLEGHVLTWRGSRPEANVEAAAREARYRLMAEWCARRGIGALYVAHTRDDQAETFLLRLSRGSGLDGLSAMAARSTVPGAPEIALLRPLLGFDRADLRAFLDDRGIGWHDDPMNGDEHFARVRIRKAWPALETAGLTKVRIADAASHLARARAALEWETGRVIEAASRVTEKGVELECLALADVPREIGLRVLAALLMQVGAAAYRPRFERLVGLFEALTAPGFRKARTLHGCRIGLISGAVNRSGSVRVVIAPEKERRPTKSRR